MEQMIYEIIGYIASFLVALSLMMSSILRLRVINLVGASFFALYGLLIGAFPVAVVNGVIALINIYYLYDMFSTKEYFRILEVKPNSDYLRHFLNYYDAEIQKFFPSFRFVPESEQVIFFILRDMVPAALLVAEVQDEQSLLVHLDFVIPGYRDLKVGRFIYDEHPETFTSKGYHQLHSKADTSVHQKYLERLGFTLDSSQPSKQFIKTLKPLK